MLRSMSASSDAKTVFRILSKSIESIGHHLSLRTPELSPFDSQSRFIL